MTSVRVMIVALLIPLAPAVEAGQRETTNRSAAVRKAAVEADILRYEQNGAFEGAAVLMTATDARRKSLAKMIATLTPASDLEHAGDYAGAKQLFNDLLTRLDMPEDQPLIAYARRETLRLDSLARKLADANATSLIADGDHQVSIGDYAGADSTYTKVVERKADISPSIFKTATEKLVAVRTSETIQPSPVGTWIAFNKAAADFLVRVFGWSLWVGYGIILVLLPFAMTFAFVQALPEKKETLLALEDLTAPTPGSAANSALTEQMRREMVLAPPTRDGVRVDRAMDTGGSSLGHVWLGLPLPALDAVLQSATTLAFGPFSINPLQILKLFQPLLRRRRRYELRGRLSTVGSTTVFHVALSHCPSMMQKQQWEQTAVGTDARARVIRAVSTQVTLALDRQEPLVTKDWRSYRALRDGVEFLQLAAADVSSRTTNLESARARFQEAVLFDGDNWLARLNLGDALRKIGLNVAAAEQFKEALECSRLPVKHRPVAMYNRAAALQKTDDEEVAKSVISLLKELLAMHDLDPTLERMARSGLLAAEADRLGRRRRRLSVHRDAVRADYEAIEKTARELLAQGHDMVHDLEADIRRVPADEAASEENNIVRAVAYNALGQLATLAGRPHEARDYCRHALTLLPSFVEAAINLAAVYEEANVGIDREWATRAERLLVDVLSLDPSNTRALVLLGKIYADPIFSRLDDAATQFKKALPDVSAAVRLGRVYMTQGKFGDAIAPLESARSRNDRPGTAAMLLATCALELPMEDRRRCPLLDRAAKWMIKLGEEDNHTGRHARQLAEQVAQALNTCRPGAQPDTPPPTEDARV